MSLSWLTRKNVKKGRVSEILLIPVSPLIVQGWEVSTNPFPPKQHGHISPNAKQKTASQLMQFSSRYGPLKFVSSFFSSTSERVFAHRRPCWDASLYPLIWRRVSCLGIIYPTSMITLHYERQMWRNGFLYIMYLLFTRNCLTTLFYW